MVGLGSSGDDSAVGGVAGLAELAAPEDALQRSHSTSSIHDILQSQMVMSPIDFLESPFKSRSSSFDDLVSLSGSPTPTLTPTKAQFRL